MADQKPKKKEQLIKIGKDFLKESHFEFYEKMGWSHNKNCICKDWQEKENKDDTRFL